MSERSNPRLPPVPMEFVPVLVVGASAILGSVLGEAAYYTVTGRAASSVGVLPWWMVVVFAAGAIVLASRWRGATIRAALVLFVVRQCMTLTPARGPSIWLLGLIVTFVAVVLVQIACWRLATARVKWFAVLAVVTVMPLRYWSIHNWFSIVSRYRGLGD